MDVAISPSGNKYLFESDELNTSEGNILKKNVKNGKVKSSTGAVFTVVKASVPDLYERMRRGPQVITLKDAGYILARAGVGKDSFVVDALPSCIGGTDPRVLLIDISGSLEKAGARGGAAASKEEAVARAACRAATMANDKMTLAEIEQLVVDLANTEMPYTCPHGRPTLIYTSFSELDKKFGRK